MLNKIMAFIIIFCLIYPSVIWADLPDLPPQPKITSLQKDQKAPYAGVLLNSIAAAKIFTEKDFSTTECDLRVKYEVDKALARTHLLLEITKASMESMEAKYTTLLQIKNKEIERLSKITSEINDYSTLWAAGGVVVGIGLTLAVVYAVKAGDI